LLGRILNTGIVKRNTSCKDRRDIKDQVMAIVKPFCAIRPVEKCASEVAALPYDVYSREEARRTVAGHPLSFLNIDRPETQFPEDFDMYSKEVYEKASSMLEQEKAGGIFTKESIPCFYIYELTMDGRTQTGICALSSVDDYLNNICKKHENTVAEKERDRINHVDICSAQTGPIFLAYRNNDCIDEIVEAVKKGTPLYDFISDDGIRHRVFRINDAKTVTAIETAFKSVPNTYIADGHHRAASAVKVALKRRQEHPDYNGSEEFNYFLSVLFPESELKILPYNRVVHDLNGMDVEGFIRALEQDFCVEKSNVSFQPQEKGEIGMYIGKSWYRLKVKDFVLKEVDNDPVRSLDVAILQDKILSPILEIEDPRTDHRINFVGGIRGLKELETEVDKYDEKTGPAVAFSMFPTSISELLSVADAGKLMPPKSTWFEPKLRSGLFIHEIER
jgi:uncharacterized protein (DUF1015 family)